MPTIIQSLPKDHFGDLTHKLIHNALSGESALVYGMPGIGTNYLFNLLEHLLQVEHGQERVYLFKGGVIKSNPIEQINKQIFQEGKINPLSELRDLPEGQKIFVLLNSLEKIPSAGDVMDYLESLQNYNPTNFVLLASVDYSLFTTFKENLYAHGATLPAIYKQKLFDLEGTYRIVQLNNQFLGWKTPINSVPRIYELSGGNPRFIKFICHVVEEEDVSILDDLKQLVSSQTMAMKLHCFLNLFLELDTNILTQLDILNSKGQIFSPMLEYFLTAYESPSIKAQFPTLNNDEKRILNLLIVNMGKLVEKERLNQIMGLIGENHSMWASYKSLSRLRQKISHQYDLKAVKGQGYILTPRKDDDTSFDATSL